MDAVAKQGVMLDDKPITKEQMDKIRVHEQIHAIKSIQEQNRHYLRSLNETREKLAIHEHYMYLTKRLEDRGSKVDCYRPDSYVEKLIYGLVKDLENSVSEKSPAPDMGQGEDTCKSQL
jgi:hypothetical protein